MNQIDLNVDIGEGFPFDEALLEFATSANVCCGEHAGSQELTMHTVEICRARGIRVGAHPGYPDRQNMGRKTPDAALLAHYLASVKDQVSRFIQAFGAAYVKPHGAFYNDAAQRPEAGHTSVQVALGEILRSHRLPLMGMYASAHAQIADRAGVLLIHEGFADRSYDAEGQLVSRSQPNAILQDEAKIARQVLFLAERVDSICLHGDTPDALRIAELVRKTLADAGYEVRA